MSQRWLGDGVGTVGVGLLASRARLPRSITAVIRGPSTNRPGTCSIPSSVGTQCFRRSSSVASAAGQRSAKVLANAFRAGFHLIVRRTWPLLVGVQGPGDEVEALHRGRIQPANVTRIGSCQSDSSLQYRWMLLRPCSPAAQTSAVDPFNERSACPYTATTRLVSRANWSQRWRRARSGLVSAFDLVQMVLHRLPALSGAVSLELQWCPCAGPKPLRPEPFAGERFLIR